MMIVQHTTAVPAYRQWAAMFTAGDPELAAQPAALVTSPQPTVTAADEHAVTVKHFCCMTLDIIRVHECVAHATTCCACVKRCCACMAVLLSQCCWSCWVQVLVISTELSRTITAATSHCAKYIFPVMATMQEYLGWSGVWQESGPDQATGYNELLADVIAEGATAGASKASPQGAPLQDIPLRLALVGAPFAGKTSMALKLADEHGCKVCWAHYCGKFRQ